MATETLDPNHPDWLRGYADGKGGKPHSTGEGTNYHDGWLTGGAEQGMGDPATWEKTNG